MDQAYGTTDKGEPTKLTLQHPNQLLSKKLRGSKLGFEHTPTLAWFPL